MTRASTLALLLLVAACGDDGTALRPPIGAAQVTEPEPVGQRTEALPAPQDDEKLVQAHHLIAVTGDLVQARQLLTEVLERSSTRRTLRARAALQLAELAEITGDRRGALVYLERAKAVIGQGHPLALEADDRRARILTATPLADVRGPVPGSVPLKQEPTQVAAAFRQAEALLARYHRVVVAPELENINEVLRTKRRALAVAVAAYQQVATGSTGAGRAAARFRLGAMFHHLAEALAFAIPSELLPSVARQLRRQLQAESTAYLRRALGYYRDAAAVPPGPGTSPWRQLAEREAKTLGLVLKASRKRGK